MFVILLVPGEVPEALCGGYRCWFTLRSVSLVGVDDATHAGGVAKKVPVKATHVDGA